MMKISHDFCEKVAVTNKNILAAYLVEKGTITQWILRPAVKVPQSVERMQTVVIQRAMLFELAKAQDDFLGSLHYVMSKYDDSDLYIFEIPFSKRIGEGKRHNINSNEDDEEKHVTDPELPIFDRTLLIIRIKPHYSLSKLVDKIRELILSSKSNNIVFPYP